MKNLYLYGASDDLYEVESDFGLRDEFYDNYTIKFFSAELKVIQSYDGDWKINITGDLPHGWVYTKISGTSDFVHIQIPDDEAPHVKLVGPEEDNE